MPCRSAWLMREPVITEITETKHSSFNPRTKGWDVWTEPLMVPSYKVDIDYDFRSSCCGSDHYSCEFATREGADKWIASLKANKHPWIRFDQEFFDDIAAEDEE